MHSFDMPETVWFEVLMYDYSHLNKRRQWFVTSGID